MRIQRAFKFRLYETSEQRAAFVANAGAARFVYNLALDQRSNWHRQKRAATGSSITFNSQDAELTALRAECEWLNELPRVCQTQALRDLDKAFQNFWSGSHRYPGFRSKDAHNSFRFAGRDTKRKQINRRFSQVFLPKIGWVKFRQRKRPIEGHVESVTITREADGWHVVFACRIERKEVIPLEGEIGIDRGVSATLALSDGRLLHSPEQLEHLDRKARKAARALARKRKGSNRREKAKRRLAKIKAKAARVRKHWNHVQTIRIARKHGHVAIEALRTSSMMRSAKGTVEAPGRNVRQKAGLNRSIAERGWYQIEQFLEYKLAERGGVLVKVNPAYTSQTCAECGTISKANRKSQARFVCQSCGHADNADVNAARNIVRLSRSDAKDRGGRPVGAAREAGKSNRRLAATEIPVL